MNNKSIIISAITAGLILSGCGGGGDEKSTPTQSKSQKVGYLIDAPIVGATYLADGKKEFTQVGGSFKYSNEAISFYVGDLFLGKIDKVPNDKIVLLQDILGIPRNDLSNTKLIKVATLIQSLDSDSNTKAIELKQGILIGQEYKKSIDDIDVDALLHQKGITKKSPTEVAKHLRDTLDSVSDTNLPTLKKLYPLNGQGNVPLNVNIELKFSKFLKYDTFLNKVFIRDADGNSVQFNTYLNENTMTLKPHALKKSTTYNITIDGVKDYNSNLSKKITFYFVTTGTQDTTTDTSSGASLKVETGGGTTGGGTTDTSSGVSQVSTGGNSGGNNSNQNTSAVNANITATQGSTISWDRATVFDAVGKIEDRVDYGVVKGFGMTKFGTDLETSERVVSLDGKNNFLVAGSKYHNALNVIDYNKGTYNYNKFASFRVNYNVGKGGLTTYSGISTGGGSGNVGGGTSGGGVDTSSGASGRSLARAYTDESCSSIDKKNPSSLWEHSLSDAKITGDGGYVYALILPRFSVEAYNANATFGLFRTRVGYCGVNPYNANSTNKVDSRGISQMELSSNDTMLAVYGEADSQKILRVYNSTLTSVISAINLDNLASFDFAFNDSFIVGAISQTYTQKPKLVKFSASNLSSQMEKEIPFSADTVLGSSGKIIALSKSKGLVGSFDANLNMLKEIKVNYTPTKAAISPNGAYLALGNAGSIYVYDISGSSITKLTSSSTNGLRALSFVNDSLLAYTPTLSANSVVTLKIEKASTDTNTNQPTPSTPTFNELGSFSSMSALTTTSIYGKTKLFASSGNRALSYTQLAPDDKGYNVFDMSADTFKFTEGSRSSVDKFYRDEIMQMKLLDSSSFVIVSVNYNYPAFSSIYIQNILSDGTLEDSYNITNTASISIGNYGTPLSAKIAKDTNTIFITKKALVQNYYLVDIYEKNGNTYAKSQSDIALQHLDTHINSVVPTDSGNDFYSIGGGKVYQNSTNKSVVLPNANGVFYGANLVLATTSDGKLYTYDKDLVFKKAYKLDVGSIKDIQSSGSSIVVFAENGVYTLRVQGDTLKAEKSLSVPNLANGHVEGSKIFAISNSSYSANSPNNSDIYYMKY